MDTNILLVVLCIMMAVLIIVMFSLLQKQAKKDNHTEDKILQTQMTKQLLDFQNAITQSLRKDINVLNENTSDKLFKMEHNVNRQLNTGFESTNKVFTEVMKQITKIDSTQDQLKLLSQDISSLHSILNDKKTRGIYGEIELYNLLENAFGLDYNRYAKQYKLSNGLMVDAVIFGNEALGTIPIDSKFPLENFNRLMDPSLPSMRKQVIQNEFKSDVKKHIKAIATKYIIPNETSEFAYMFIPAEAIFSYINANLNDVIEYSYQEKVYLVSPTTLMAYITAIKALYLGQKKNERIKEIQEELIKLSIEFERFSKRYETVQRDFDRSYSDMKDVLVTANKIITRFKKIEAVELEKDEDEH
ncbi:DNA recombination protein RmuC [Breznakia sp. PF5-3]|uniref:DNA recombination protein RmuC n=1 Tax=unclassified Breznakia TaxID=2623764 RepID=UPI002405DF3D|nr:MULTISPECIES: DNA recombination protein RmuC [unclassified Breznakia]MDL2276617.1 DNA recombination protein RmuC [Breznakia sp. OttesenSCG-928-G09]MDF9824661.1 DNA recombination protein RmuC [Breznakia sp. PM6-1]MDF9835646.1 DNA recombination protein RmuC [Breznakia sp. PF5-3]MDF9837689.1 DNA recombination protein RmuC [Breznakia sp. PFB2-8]MDF9859553.1 DNA recombination protein RmuC [Breznakia sp. PH5-24]